ncbi:lipoyl(octanoyl) transferase LipB [Amphibiibacter pelophylacis]|uniref:Lipoyl(Octanoyl) transferase LipB n=1 Tax=Amphibiibacter pelophylacis TaxID=1799477 RepID=A0ACC6NY83_9BURK
MDAAPVSPPVAPCAVVRHLGEADYAATFAAMVEFTAQRGADTPDEIWVCSHPPVYTQGVAGLPEHLLRDTGIPVVRSNRGGQITYHGPGQIVIYPLLHLGRLGLFVRTYVKRLEEALILTLADFGLAGERAAGAPGVYVRSGPPQDSFSAEAGAAPLAGLQKIAALGVKVSRQCSYHGLALNVAMDLSPFDAINPCGYAGLVTTDMARQGVHADPALVAQRLVEHLIAQLMPPKTPC